MTTTYAPEVLANPFGETENQVQGEVVTIPTYTETFQKTYGAEASSEIADQYPGILANCSIHYDASRDSAGDVMVPANEDLRLIVRCTEPVLREYTPGAPNPRQYNNYGFMFVVATPTFTKEYVVGAASPFYAGEPRSTRHSFGDSSSLSFGIPRGIERSEEGEIVARTGFGGQPWETGLRLVGYHAGENGAPTERIEILLNPYAQNGILTYPDEKPGWLMDFQGLTVADQYEAARHKSAQAQAKAAGHIATKAV